VYERFASHAGRRVPQFPAACRRRAASDHRRDERGLDTNLRDWARGRRPIQKVYEALDVAAELLLA